MRQIIKILVAIGILAFAASITAGSCDKAADPNNNVNNTTNTNTNTNGSSGGGSSSGAGDGGNGNNGGTVVNNYKRPTAIADAGDVKIINVNTGIAKVDTTTTIPTIKIKASGLTAAFNFTFSTPFGSALTGGTIFKVFEITNEKASEGMVLVGKGDVASADKITTGAVVTTYPANATGEDGVHILHAATAAGKIFSGLNFISVFANKTAQTDSDKNTEPFAFSSRVYTNHLGTFTVKPFFFCGSAASLATASTIAATDKLTGGHKADCYVGLWGRELSGQVIRDPWFGSGAPFKREIQVAITAIRTDDWTIGDLLSDGTAAANISAFNDGISAIEMKRITESNSNPVPFKRYSIKIVQDTDF